MKTSRFVDSGLDWLVPEGEETPYDDEDVPGPEGEEDYEHQPATKQRAAGGRVAPENINHEPSEAQKRSGNYAKDKVRIHGLELTIENAKGKPRRGVGPDGEPWSVLMPAHYGYIRKV